ncbi:MAG TPA: solute carrier family 23 protein [Acetobacteraceae bacterium]|nr:solute carrier family 23 protein [Acetobacteraceae bacterium]
MKKPANLVYGSDEEPPIAITIISAVQHVGVIAIFMIYPLIIARQAGVPPQEIVAILRRAMLVLGVAVVLQALPRGPVGSRFLAPSIFTGVYLAPSLLAAKLGGMPLVWGMTIFAGLVEIGLSRIWSRLRVFVPPEIAGMVILLVGVIIGLAALGLLLRDAGGRMVSGGDALIAGVSIGTMIALNIWNKGRLRLFCILVGMVVGYALSGLTGHITGAQVHAVLSQPVLALPSLSHLRWAFDASMIIPFAVTGLAAAMSATAVVTTYQRINDAEWVRPEIRSIGGGIFGDGISAVVAGLLGTYGLTISTANVGLVAATGVASRRIAFLIAALLAVAAFQPTFVGVLTIMPPPVMASALLFTSVFIMISGIQIISTRILDARRTLVIGAGIMGFLMDSVSPSAFAGVPHWLAPVLTSPLVLATMVALLLNLLFRLGIRRTVGMPVDPHSFSLQDIGNFIERAAGAWGARRDVTARVGFAVQQAVEAIIEFCHPSGPIELAVSYDEFDIDAKLTYDGVALELPEWPPSHEEVLEAEDGARRLSGFLVRQQANRAQSGTERGAMVLRLHFEH